MDDGWLFEPKENKKNEDCINDERGRLKHSDDSTSLLDYMNPICNRQIMNRWPQN